jgi:hypothetical protein
VKDNAATPGEQQPLKAGDAVRRSCTGRRASLIFRPRARRRAPVRIGGQPARRGRDYDNHDDRTGMVPEEISGQLSPNWCSHETNRSVVVNGALAQLVARLHGMQEVRSSNLLGSTKPQVRRFML